MLRVLPLAAVCAAAIATAASSQVPQRRQPPFFPAGIAYDGYPPPGSDLAAIRSQGFNSVSVSVKWADAEPRRGSREFTPVAHILEAAARADLRVIVRVETDPAPGWLLREFPDGRVLRASGAAAPGAHACFDHEGVRAAEEAFIAALTGTIAPSPSLYAIDYTGYDGAMDDVPVCFCKRTRAAFRTWLEQGYGSLAALSAAWSRPFAGWSEVHPVPVASPSNASAFVDWQTFSALRLKEHLAARIRAAGDRGSRLALAHSRVPGVLTDAASPPGTVDDWEMSAAAEQFGMLARGAKEDANALPEEAAGLAFDGIRSAAAGKGWLLTTVAGRRRADAATAAEVRFQAWVALSRGVRGLFVPPDGSSERTASLAGNLTRNAALFVPLRPTPARVALVYNRPSYGREGRRLVESTALLYRAAFTQNIAVDVLHSSELLAGGASGYDVLLLPSLLLLPPPVVQTLRNFVSGGGTLIAIAAEEQSAGLSQPAAMADLFGAAKRLRIPSQSPIVANRFGAGRAILIGTAVARGRDVPTHDAARAEQNRQLGALITSGGVRPEIAIDGGAGDVEARVLESSDAVVIIGMNHGRSARKVTFRFTPETPEAIWQNMETGAAVNFVAEAAGPTYTHTIGPRDVLVLMIRKALR